MFKLIKKPVIIYLIAAMIVTSIGATAFAQSTPSAGAMITDTVLARPLGLGALVVGTAAFIVSLPFSALGGNVGQAFKQMMVHPTRFTFMRPIGVF